MKLKKNQKLQLIRSYSDRLVGFILERHKNKRAFLKFWTTLYFDKK